MADHAVRTARRPDARRHRPVDRPARASGRRVGQRVVHQRHRAEGRPAREHLRHRRPRARCRGFETEHGNWMEADRNWIRRAERGPGTAGGPDRTRTVVLLQPRVPAVRARRGARSSPVTRLRRAEPVAVVHPAADAGRERRHPVVRRARRRPDPRSAALPCPPASPSASPSESVPPSEEPTPRRTDRRPRHRPPRRRRHRHPRRPRRRHPTPTPPPEPTPTPTPAP